MEDTLQPLLDRAFHRAAAREANSAIAEARELAGAEEPFSYEVLLESWQTLSQLAEKILPKLVYHLESRGARGPGFEGVFLSLFAEDALVFVHARDAMPLLAAAVGKSFEELEREFGTGELRRAIRPDEVISRPSPAPMLPGKPK